MSDDLVLLQKISSGDNEALQELFARYARQLYADLYKITKNKAIAKEVMLATFKKLYIALHENNEQADVPYKLISALADLELRRVMLEELQNDTSFGFNDLLYSLNLPLQKDVVPSLTEPTAGEQEMTQAEMENEQAQFTAAVDEAQPVEVAPEPVEQVPSFVFTPAEEAYGVVAPAVFDVADDAEQPQIEEEQLLQTEEEEQPLQIEEQQPLQADYEEQFLQEEQVPEVIETVAAPAKRFYLRRMVQADTAAVQQAEEPGTYANYYAAQPEDEADELEPQDDAAPADEADETADLDAPVHNTYDTGARVLFQRSAEEYVEMAQANRQRMDAAAIARVQGEAAVAQKPVSMVSVLGLGAVIAVLLWAVLGILMDMQILPELDMGYSLFNRILFDLF